MPLNVYYIDDENDLCEIFKELFERENVVIKTFTDSDLGLQAIHNNPPDLLFLDYRLPKITGDALASLVPQNIPKALVTGDLQIKGIENFNAIFSKPFNHQDIEKFIKSFNIDNN